MTPALFMVVPLTRTTTLETPVSGVHSESIPS